MKRKAAYLVLGILGGLVTFTLYSEFASKFSGTKDVTLQEKRDLDLSSYETAIFSGGCFWCTEADFEKTDGVIEAISGYTGGHTVNPTYEESNTGTTGHREAVQVYYDPDIVKYKQLLDVFWRHHDPRDAGGSFGDRGPQYASAVYYKDTLQKDIIEGSIRDLSNESNLGAPIETIIEQEKIFYVAEDYHQDYYLKNPSRYKIYRGASGRDRYVEDVWGNELVRAQAHAGGNMAKKDLMKNKQMSKKKNPYYIEGRDKPVFSLDYTNYKEPSDDEMREKLTDVQYKVTRHEGTERPFHNPYWDNKEPGIYVDIISGEPLYSSKDKYDSGTGWPSFYKPIAEGVVTEHEDRKLPWEVRTEIRSAIADNHIGHIILDGPEWNDRIRHCMNSAALRFVPVSELEAQGYGNFTDLFR